MNRNIGIIGLGYVGLPLAEAYIKQNISKQNLIIDRDEFLDATGKYPGK